MRIGIITFHSVTNYGAALQAYALQQVLKQTGHKVEIINYSPDALTSEYRPFSLYKYKKMSFKKIVRQFLAEAYHFIDITKKNNAFKSFFKKHYQLSGKEIKTYKLLLKSKLKYDVCFAGSDQIWNPDITIGFDESYFLKFGNSNMVRATYAASIGKERFNQSEQLDFLKLLEKIDYISMRESAVADYVNSISNSNAITVLDPTLLLTKNDWSICFDFTPVVKQKYIFVYALYPNEELTKMVESLSKKKNLPIVSIEIKKLYSNELKRFPYADPCLFVNLVANAEYVVTDSFHGTAFSVNLSKNFYTLLGGRSSRITNLLSKVGLNERAFINYSEELLNLADIDWDSVEEKLNDEREGSFKYIKDVLSDGRIND